MRLWKLIGLGVACLVFAGATHAQSGISLTSAPPPTYTFGEVLTFSVSAQSHARIKSVTLFYRTLPDADTRLGKPRFTPGPNITATHTLSLTASPLPAFAQIEYWWEIEDSDNQTLTTDKQTFRYEDNRFEWRSLAQDALAVHWYQGGTAFGQTALDIAAGALAQINHDLNAPAPDTLDIYIYASDADARDALRGAGVAWANGHANPAIGVALITVTPDVLDSDIHLAMLIPHELTHIAVYRATGGEYARVPLWLNEGLAELYQVQPNPNFPGALNRARKDNALLPLESLCTIFPADDTQAELAYAESESVVRYVRDQHGASALAALLTAYADGLSCDGGVQRALHLTLAELEQNWLRDKISLNPATFNLRKLSPWLAAALVIVFSGGMFLFLTLAPVVRRPKEGM